ncbi:hypothetical protein [Ruminococcus callidus]|uniref:hypothetical protein n=1 Tax=Ruminococcus TaxID=1263 RepID=UPI000B13EC79|nr:hypothetical protein [Ruminococcus callidus]MCB5774690.1 hypothetical protein [Ruminococcus callidus]
MSGAPGTSAWAVCRAEASAVFTRNYLNMSALAGIRGDPMSSTPLAEPSSAKGAVVSV